MAKTPNLPLLSCQTSNLVRLVDCEYEQMLKIGQGNHFLHINLQHSGYPDDALSQTNYYAVRIVSPGKASKDHQQFPVLDFENYVQLSLIKSVHSLPVSSLSRTLSLVGDYPLLLTDASGPLLSLYQKYNHVRELTLDQIFKMSCFVRLFRIEKILNNHPSSYP